jgi:hypothetical protein
MRENLCQLLIRQDVWYPRCMKNSKNVKRTKNPINKWSNELNSSQKKKYKWPINM